MTSPQPIASPSRDLGRRTMVAVLVAAVLGAPPLVMRLLCVGDLCREDAVAAPEIPFCSLDPALRRLLEDGFRDGRSPDVLAVTTEAVVRGGAGQPRIAPPWPSTVADDAGRVPLVFHGTGVDPDAEVPGGTGLVDLAPTAAGIIGVERPHPEVRVGAPIPGVAAGDRPRLLLLVAWKGVGSRDLEARPDAWPTLRGLLEKGTGTIEAEVGSLPLDPTAVLTTIGTGGLPREHGITGGTVRNEEGRAVAAWGAEAPFSVISALGDDLDEVLGQEPRVGLVGTHALDRGLIGQDWYIETDEDDEIVAPGRPDRQVDAARELLTTGYGADEVPDLLAVAMADTIPRMDRALGDLLDAAREAAGGSVALAVTSTGSVRGRDGDTIRAADLVREVERRAVVEEGDLIEAMAVGGLFIDQDVLVEAGITENRAITALRGIEGPGGGRIMADVFSGRAVEFARFC
jgi:hypothetical protein